MIMMIIARHGVCMYILLSLQRQRYIFWTVQNELYDVMEGVCVSQTDGLRQQEGRVGVAFVTLPQVDTLHLLHICLTQTTQHRLGGEIDTGMET